MTKQIKALRKATLQSHKEPGKASLEPTIHLIPGTGTELLDFEGEPKKISENHVLYEVRLKSGGLVYLVEGVDFEFIK